MDIHAALFSALPMGASRDQVVTLLGEPQDTGKGMGASILFAYRDKTIQCSFCDDRLFLLAFYFPPTAASMNWPQCMAALADFSDVTTVSEVEGWLQSRGIPSKRITICGETVIETPNAARFSFESGRLFTIQITSETATLHLLS